MSADFAILITQWAKFYKVFREFVTDAWIDDIKLDYEFRVSQSDNGYMIYGNDNATHTYPPDTLIQVKVVDVDKQLEKLKILKANVDKFKAVK